MNITERIIESLKSSGGGWRKRHLAEMGQSWPPLGIPVKLLPPETVRYGKTEYFDSEEEMIERITGRKREN